MGRTRGGGNGRISSSFLVVLLFIALVSQDADMATAQRDSPSGRGPSYFNPQSFNPSMAVIIVVLVTAFFFLGFFSIYLRRCAGSPLGPGPAGVGGDLLALGAGSGITFAAGAAALRPRTPRGLDPAALRALPTMAYADVKAHRVGKGELECAVCLSEFDDRDALRLLPRCSHAFHVDCIDAWLASHVTCPVCRANLVFPEASAPAPAPTVVQPQDVLPAAATAEEVATAPPEPVAIAIDAEETEEERVKREEAAELVRIGSVKRALRSKSGRPPSPAQFPFPRSHTTGHSLAVAGGVAEERYTLRLPEHVLREAVAAGELRRTKSLQAFRDGTSGRSARRGFGFGFGGAAPRAGRSVRLGQSGRWPNMSALLARTFSSARMPAAWGASARRGEQADDAPGKVVESNAAAGQQCDGGAGAACPLPLGGGRV